MPNKDTRDNFLGQKQRVCKRCGILEWAAEEFKLACLPKFKRLFPVFLEEADTQKNWEVKIRNCFVGEKMTDRGVPTVRVNPDTLLFVVQSLLSSELEREREELETQHKRELVQAVEDYKEEIWGKIEALPVINADSVMLKPTVVRKDVLALLKKINLLLDNKQE